MRISLDYEKKTQSETIIVVETFLNFHLGAQFYGESFDSIFIEFIENPKPNKKFKRRILYGQIAEIALPQNFETSENLSIDSFNVVFDSFVKALVLLDEINIKNNTFQKKDFLKDVNNLRSLIPNSNEALNKWKLRNKVYRELEDKINHLRNSDPEFDKREQAKNYSLREFDMRFEEPSHLSTKEEQKKHKHIKDRNRKKAIPICWIQSEFFTRYIRKEMRKLKFTGQFATIDIELSDHYEIKKGIGGLSILIPFDKNEYRKAYPPYEVDIPLKSIISNENESQTNDFLASLLIDAMKFASKKKLLLPCDEIIQIIEDFKNKQYSFTWYHRRRIFKELGIGARLFCQLKNNAFTLNFILLKNNKEIFKKEIHKSQPWHEAWRSYYDDIIFEDGKLTVTQLYAGTPIFEITTKEIKTIVDNS